MSRILRITVLTIVSLLAGVTAVCRAQTGDTGRNYIGRSRMLDAAGITRQTTVTYYDGLGQPEETVAVGAGGSGMSLVTYSTRDRAGRIISEVTAPAGSGGEYVPGAQVIAAAKSYHADSKPYSLIAYEQSESGRQLSVTGPGQAWHNAGKAVNTRYLTNEANDGPYGCLCFDVSDTRLSADTLLTLKCSGRYEAGRLFVTCNTDEDGHVNIDFTDKEGHTVLRRSAGSIADANDRTKRADTYYVYDVTGRLTAVLQPMLSGTITGEGTWLSTHESLRRYAYLYIYDGRGHLSCSREPGCAWIIMRRDRGGRVIYTQDGHMRQSGKALLTLRDGLGRPCVTALVASSLTAADGPLPDVVTVRRRRSGDIAPGIGGYTVIGNTLTPGKAGLLKSSYYDDYTFLDSIDGGSELTYREKEGYDSRWTDTEVPALSARGWRTGSLTNVLGTERMLGEAVYYDSHGNIIQRHAQNYLGGAEHYYYRLSFSGLPLAILHVHTTADTTVTEEHLYTYDHAERMLTESIVRNGVTTRLLINTYDELGRHASVRYGSGYERETTVTTEYNVRGLVTAINNGHFSQRLHYHDNYGESTPCWNGNISAMEWSSPEYPSSAGNFWQSYTYTYDGLQRLKEAVYTESAGITPRSPIERELMNARDYSCSYRYDLQGNITTLRRKGMASVVCDGDVNYITYGDIDNLTLTYDGNRLVKVTDAAENLSYAGAMDFRDGVDRAVEYTYDDSGNMRSDLNKGINNIRYNVLNLPNFIEFEDGHSISYIYDADGNRLRTVSGISGVSISPVIPDLRMADGAGTDGISAHDLTGDSIAPTWPGSQITRDYCGNRIYVDGRLERVLNSCGYTDSSGKDYYYIKDYLGNVRSVIDDKGYLVEVNDYYPYGALMNTLADNPSRQPYKYGTKELDRTAGLDLYDSHARQYDPILGRTTTIDPRSDIYFPISHYAWCAGNPVNYIDPDGMDIFQLDTIGQFHLEKPDDKNYDIVMGENGATLRVEKGFLNPIFQIEFNISERVTLYKTSNPVNAKRYFEFFADNSRVEWSVLYKRGGETYIGTSNLQTRDYTVGVLQKMYPDLINMIERFDHSHPSESGPSIPDFNAASEFPNKGEKVKFHIYLVTTKDYHLYTHNFYEFTEIVVEPKVDSKN